MPPLAPLASSVTCINATRVNTGLHTPHNIAATPRSLPAAAAQASPLQRAARRCCRAHAEGQGPGSPAAGPPPEQQAQAPAGSTGGDAQPPQDDVQLDPALDTNVWAYKPAWCQPYSILATGTAVVAGVWLVSGGSPWWSGAAALPVGAWWYLFLIIYPAQFQEYIASLSVEQRRQLAAQLAAQAQVAGRRGTE